MMSLFLPNTFNNLTIETKTFPDSFNCFFVFLRYTREAYLELVDHIRSIIPEVSLSSDFIAGFCGETEREHQDTLSLLKLVRYNYAFLFAYSMRKVSAVI